MTSTNIYMDYAAATPMLPKVLRAMEPYFSEKFYNPSAIYLDAKQVSKDLHTAREKVARIIGSKPAEVYFVAGGTEANNLAISGIMSQFPGKKILLTAIEHDSVIKPAGKYEHDFVPVSGQGLIDVDRLNKQIDDETVLLSIIYANNEIGVLQPLSRVSSLVQEIRRERKNRKINTPLYLHTDACQAACYLDINVARLGVDLMTLNGGKIYGPKQSGILYVKSSVSIRPQIIGGGQEGGLRSGTENMPAVIGFVAALEAAQSSRHYESKRIAELNYYFRELIAQKIPSAFMNGSIGSRLPNNINLTIPGIDNERVIMELDEAGVQAASGSACSASSDEPSHVLSAIGLSTKDIQSSIRFTLGKYTEKSDIEYVMDRLSRIVVY